MAISTRLADSLRRALGDDAAEDLVRRLEEGDDLRADLAEFRETMRVDFAEFRETMRADIAEFRQEVTARFVATDRKVDAVESGLKLEIRDARIDVIKWSFVFWITTLGTLLLGRLLR